MEALRAMRARAIDPDKIDWFIMLVTEDLAFQLHGAVQHAKFELSIKQEACSRSAYLEFTFHRRSLEPSSRSGFRTSFMLLRRVSTSGWNLVA